MKEFKFRISADVADLEAQFKSGANQLAKFVQGIDKAENKLEKLQETSAYLSQMDAALSSLASKYPNIFKQIFGNVDADIKNAIKPILEMQELMSTVVNQTGSKLQNILGGTGGTAAEFKEIANTMSILSKALGQNAPDFSFLEGAGDATEKANKLLNVLQDIVQETYNFKNTGSDSVGAVLDEIAESSTNAASKIDELKTKIKELISIANKKKEELYTKEDILGELESPKNVSKSTQYLKNRWSDLIKLMQESQEARAKFNKGKMLSDADYESLLKYIDAVSKLRATVDTINSGKMSVNPNIFDQIRMQLSKLPQTLPYLENLQQRIQPKTPKQKNKTSQVESSKAPVQTSKAYAELNQQIEKYIQLKKESAKLDEESPEWENKAEEMDQILSDIAGQYKLSEDALETLGDKLMQRGIGVQKAMKILKDTLGDQFPAATVEQNDSVGIKETKAEAIQTASEIESLGDKSQESFSEVTHASQQATDALKDQILQVQTLKELYSLLMQEEYNFRNGQANGKEYLAMFNKNGLSNIGTSDGADITRDTIKKILSRASSNGEFMSLHNHPNGMDMPSVSDLLTWAQDFVDAGVKINGIITSSGITAIDFSDMDIDGIQKVIEKYKNIIQQDKLLNKFLDTSDPGALKWNETLENKIKADSKFKAQFTEMEPQIRAGISGALRNALNQALEEVGGKPLLSFEGKDMIPDFEKYLGDMSQNIGVDPAKIKESTTAIKAETNAIAQKITSYEELCQVVERYNALILKSQTEGQKLTQNEEAELSAINDRFAATKGVNENPDKFVDYAMSMSRISGILGEFDTNKLAQYLGVEIPQATNAAGVAVENLKAKVEEAKTKFFELTKSLDSDLFAGRYDEFSLGKSQAELDKAQQELKELAEAGHIAADVMEEVDAAYKKTSGAISASYEGIRNENMYKEESGSYDQGYLDAEKRFENDRNDYIKEANELRHQVESLEQQLAQAQAQLTSETGADNSTEISMYETLKGKITEVITEINAKTEAFKTEGTTVDSVVAQEISELDKLLAKVNEIKGAVTAKNKAFNDEGVIVGAVVGKEINALNKLKGILDSITQVLAQQIAAYQQMQQWQPTNSSNNTPSNNSKNNSSGSKRQDSATTEALKLLREEENLRVRIFGLEQKGANDADLQHLRDKIALYESLRGAIEDAMPDDVYQDYQVSAMSIEDLGDTKLTISQINADIKDRNNLEKDAITLLKEEYSLRNQIAALEKNGASAQETDPLKQRADLYERIRNNIEQAMTSEQLVNYGLQSIRLQGKNDEKLTVNNIKSNIKERVAAEKADYNELLKLQKEYATAQKDLEKTSKGQQGDAILERALQAEEAYNNKKKQINLTQEQTNELFQKELELQQELKEIKAANADKEQKASAKKQAAADAKRIAAATKAQKQAAAEAQRIAITTQNAQLAGYKNDLSKRFNATKLNRDTATHEQKAFIKSYDALIQKIQEYSIARKQMSQAEKAALEAEIEGIKQKLNAYTELDKTKAFVQGFGRTTNKKDSLTAIATSDEFVGSKTVETRLNQMLEAYRQFEVKKQEIASMATPPTDADKNQYYQLADQYTKAAQALETLIAQSRDLERMGTGKMISVDPDRFQSNAEALKHAVEQFHGKQAEIGKFNSAMTELSYRVKNSDGTFSTFTAKLDSTGTKIVEVASKANVAKGSFGKFFDSIRTKFMDAMKVFSGYNLFFKIIDEVRKGIASVTEIDSALTELKKVTDETDETYAQFLKTMSKTGAEVGVTVSNLTNMAANWARLGYSIEEAGELAKGTAVLLNVSEFTSAEDASEALISTMQAYGYAAEDSMHVVDVLNEVGNNFAVSSDGLATALQTSASALMSAGNDLNQSVALVAAANKVLQDPSQVGAALRTIALRIRGTSLTVLEEMGEETDGVIESVSKLQEKVKAISGVNILDDTGAYRDTYDILRDIAEVWDEIGRKDPKGQAALLEMLAGKNRSNALAAILTNLDDLEGAYESAMNAQGSAAAENEKYMNSIQGKIDQFNNALQTMWQNWMGSDIIKDIVGIGTALVKAADSAGVLGTALAGVATYFGGKNLFKAFGDKIKFIFQSISSSTNQADAFSKVFDIAQSGLEGVETYTKYANAIKSLNAQKQAAILINNGLSESEQMVILTRNLGSEEAARAAIAEAQLSLSHETVTMAQLEQMTATGVLTAEQKILFANILGLNVAEGANAEITKAEAAAKIQAAIAAGTLSAADKELIMTVLGLSVGNTGLTFSFKALATAIYKTIAAIIKFLVLTPVGQAILVGGAIIGVAAAISKANREAAEARSFETLSKNLSEIRDKSQELNTELSTVKDRIEELEGKDTLSFTDDQELKKLQAQRIELERLVALEKEKEKRQAKKAGEAFVEEAKSNPLLNGQKVATYRDSNNKIVEESQAVVTDNYGAIINVKEGYTQDYDLTVVQQQIQRYNQAKEDVDTATQELAAAMADDKTTDAEIAKLEKNVNRAKSNLQAVETTLSGYQDQATDMLNQEGVEWQFADESGYLEDWQIAMNQQIQTIYDIQDAANIAMDTSGSAMEMALERIFKVTGANDQGIQDLQKVAAETQNLDTIVNSLEGNQQLLAYFNALGIEANDVANYLLSVDSAAISGGASVESVGKAYSSYASTLEQFTNAGSIANEIIYDNIELTEEQGKALQELIGSEAEYADAVDTSNGYVVKNARLAKDLIAKKRLEAAQNAKVEKTQARLQYYDLYKQIHKLSQANGELSAKNKEQINILYNEMKTVAQTIQKYATLERQLLGVANAYTEFANAKEIDDANTYDSELSEMVQYLANAFNTGELGTAQAQAAINGLIPQEVIDRAGTLDERMQHIYEYFTGGPLSKYVTVEFDEEGSMTSAEITMENVKQFIEDGIAGIDGVQIFTGSWDSFDLAPNIKSLSDITEAYNLTADAIFAMFQTAEKHDISWLGGDFTTLMDQLMGDDLEYNLQKNMGIISEFEQKLANGNATEDDIQRYKDASTALAENTQQARDNAKAYADASTKYNEAKERAEAAQQAIANATEGQDISDLQGQVDSAIEDMQYFAKIMADNETTELTIQVAMDAVDVDIKKIEEQYSDIKDKVTQGDDGEWAINPKVEKTEELDHYISLLNEKHTLEVMQGEGVPTVLDTLIQINDVLNTITTILGKKYGVDIETGESTNRLQTILDQLSEIKPKQVVVEVLGRISNDLATFWGKIGSNDKPQRNTSKSIPKIMLNGTAHSSGDWGLPHNEHNTLVGELGQETVVNPHTGRYYTVGDNGAELVDLPKDAIIFNHKQTEELFKNGHINSRGKAYVEGNAHVDLVKKSIDGVNTWTKGHVPSDWGSSSAAAARAAKAAEDAAKDAAEIFDWFEVLLEEINEQLDLMSAKLENAVGIEAKGSILGELLGENHYKLTELNEGLKLYTDYAAKMLSKVPDEYKEMAKNGAVAITDFLGEADQKTVDAINNYREWAQKVADLNQQLEETRTTISDLRVQTLEMIRTEYDNEIGLITTVNDHIQSTIDLLEEQGQRSSANFFTEMIANSEKQLDKLKEQREAMQKELDDAVASGDVKKYSENWYEMLNAIYDVDSAIVDCKTDIEKFNNAILELHWENFEKIIDALDAVSDEAEQIRSIIDDSEITDDVGNWTNNGLTALGMAAQEMEKARYRADLYGKEIEQLNQDFAAGKYSQDEYNEKLKELKDAQWDSIEAYESAKDTLVDLNKTRVEAVKDGIQKEIDAYEKLIDKRKEDLNAQKDAHDWANTLKDRTDEIDKIQRQIDAMTGDTSAAANAQRKKLQEELAKAQKELDETYYDRDIEMQQKALDDSLESYRQSKEDRIQELEDYLKNEDQVVSDSYALILANTDAIASNLQEIAQRYGISISENVTAPWESGTTALGTYGEELDYATSSYVEMLEKVRKELIDLQIEADKTAAKLVKDINTSANQSQNANQTSGGRKQNIAGFAKGTTGVKKDQFAVIDENGLEELVMHADGGKLSYLTKGTAVIPNDLTNNIMKWGEIDPVAMLDRNKPSIGAPYIIESQMQIDMNIAEVVHIEHADRDSIPEIQDAVKKQLDSYMKNLNSGIKKYTR